MNSQVDSQELERSGPTCMAIPSENYDSSMSDKAALETTGVFGDHRGRIDVNN